MIAAITRLLIGGLWKPFAWLFGAAGLWLAGRRSASQAGKIKGLEGYRDTTKAVQDETAAHSSDDDGAIRDWLRARDPNKR